MCVKHKNSLRIQVDKDTVAKIELPPVHPAMSLFEVIRTKRQSLDQSLTHYQRFRRLILQDQALESCLLWT